MSLTNVCKPKPVFPKVGGGMVHQFIYRCARLRMLHVKRHNGNAQGDAKLLVMSGSLVLGAV